MTRIGEVGANPYEIKKVNGFMYVIVKEDTNHDSRLTGNDKKTIAFSDVSGERLKIIETKQIEKVNF